MFSPTASSGPRDAAPANVDGWVSETRREISEIVREVAAAVRQPQPQQRFLSFLADRMLRVMAAEGVVIWKRGDGIGPLQDSDWHVAVRLGRTTDETFEGPARDVHALLLNEVGIAGGPVVVPPTPGASEPDVPANPARVPVAIVPIEVHPRESTGAHQAAEASPAADYLLEVFLDGEGGVATQRGYLRFVAQMADLAAEFLRADEVRRLRKHAAVLQQIEPMVRHMHACDRAATIMSSLVDGIADAFNLDRVGLCRVSRSRAELLAVSYVATIDQDSPAAQQIRWAAESGSELSRAEVGSSQELAVAWVGSASAASTLRLVCLVADDGRELDAGARDAITYGLGHAELALKHAARLESFPGVRRLTAFFAGDASRLAQPHGVKRKLLALVMISLGILAACVPVPLTVVAPGKLRPATLQNFSAGRDAVVETVHVRHGDRVQKGDPLVTLHDDDLDQQIATLIGRRAVLVEQQTSWTQKLVDTASHRSDRTGELQHERDLAGEELRGIDQQLALLEDIRGSLVMRASGDGVVDAWQLDQHLSGRPLHRGEYMLGIVDRDTEWIVEADVPQNRISQLRSSARDATLTLAVTLQMDPANVWPASLGQVGPARQSTAESMSTNSVLIRLDSKSGATLNEALTSAPMNGSPAQVVCRCGTAPLAYALLQDAIVSLQSHYRMYFGTPNQRIPSDL